MIIQMVHLLFFSHFLLILPSQFSNTCASEAPNKPTQATPSSHQTQNSTSTPPASSKATGRSGSINFEDEVIAGMNKNPFDSLTQIGSKDNRSNSKLYKKKLNFRSEIRQNIRETGLLQ